VTEPRTIKIRHVLTPRCGANTNDGFGGLDVMSLLIMVETVEVDMADSGPLLSRVDKIEEWVDQYINRRDLTRTLDFAPTARNLALYLSRVFPGLDPDVHAVSVSIDGGPVCTVTRSD
jgi:hypothetical protein